MMGRLGREAGTFVLDNVSIRSDKQEKPGMILITELHYISNKSPRLTQA